VHWESGQATVEWVALVLLAALVLGAATAFAGREPDRGVGELVAERIVGAPGELVAADGARAGPAAPERSAPRAPAPASPSAAASVAAPAARRAGASPAIRGIGSIAKHAWIVCLGYKRWRYEREHPLAAIGGVPVEEALGIANDCLNPYDYLFED
jgi:hypothetical protein